MYTRRTSKFCEIDHTADIGLTGEGDSLPALFASLAFGMLQILFSGTGPPATHNRRISLEDPAADGLLVQWLSELNFHLTVNHFLPISISELTIYQSGKTFHLTADLSGSDIGRFPDQIKTEIKAVTYHQLSVEKIENFYRGRVIFDI